jgi:hypothetical protein
MFLAAIYLHVIFMKAQLTLTVAESKKLIAKAIISMPEVKEAIIKGKILLKGGTTVSAVLEELTGDQFWIMGRVTPLGTMFVAASAPATPRMHWAVLEGGKITDVSFALIENAVKLSRNDLFITGANAVDIYGHAAMMAGAPLVSKSDVGRIIGGLLGLGIRMIVAVGLEKLIPSTIEEAILACGRVFTDKSMGVSTGLVPLYPAYKMVTEKEAIGILADVKAIVIGSGGIAGAEGATTLVIEGSTKEVKKAFNIVKEIKGAKVSGIPESLIECNRERCLKEKCSSWGICDYSAP